MKTIVTSLELAEIISQAPVGQSDAIKTGLPTLDRLLGGVEPGELVVVSGPTGEGKTTLLLSITANMASKGIGTTWFTLEVTPSQFIKKITKASGVLPLFYMPSDTFDDIDPKHIQEWEREHGRRFEMIDWIERRIEHAIERGKEDGLPIKAVFIDHIHQIFSIAKVERNISLEMGDMVAKIKKIAIDKNITIFLVAHSKDPQEGNREPRKEDIRDSGLISRLADSIVMVWRIPNDDTGSSRRREINEGDSKAKIRVFKNRREGTLGYFVANHENHKLTEIYDEFANF